MKHDVLTFQEGLVFKIFIFRVDHTKETQFLGQSKKDEN